MGVENFSAGARALRLIDSSREGRDEKENVALSRSLSISLALNNVATL